MPRKLIALRETDLNGWYPKEPLLPLADGMILRGREENNLLVHACQTNSLFFLFLFLSFFLSVFSLIFSFFSFSLFSILWFLSDGCYYGSCLSPLRMVKAPFYSTCRGRILLFQPLTTFVWSGCTWWPPLDRLCATPHHQKKRTILFVSLPWHPFLLRCGFSLPILHGMHLMAPTQLCPFGWCVIPTGHFLQKSLGRNLKIGLLLSPPPNHALLPLTHDFTMSCIGWVQASEVWALRMPFFHMCPKSAYHSLVRRGLKVCLHSLPSVFLLFMWAVFWFTAPLRGGAFIVTGLYISWLPLFPAMSLCHSYCNDSIDRKSVV